MQQIDSQILRIAVPSIVSNITIPLLGLVDTAITGHLGAAAFIAAIAVGTSIFSLCYWIFSFLRMGTGGLTAQAFGAQSWSTCREVLRKSLAIAAIASATIIALQNIIVDVALWLMDTTTDVEHYARIYFHILVWGAPANLALSALNGWFIGLQDAKSPMIVAISQNVLNIAASCALVFGLGWKVEGVATGTLIAQWAGLLIATVFVVRHFREKRTFTNKSQATISWGRFFSVNRDIFLRTVCLVAVMFSFTAFGARQGETILAVNALLMQMFLLVSYIMDGYAYAGEAIGGQFLGASDSANFSRLTKRLFVWGIASSVIFSIAFAIAGNPIVSLLTNSPEVRTAAQPFLWVTIVIPLISVGAFIYDGLFIGTTSTREMLISIAVATAAYFLTALLSSTNTWLWIAFLLYLALRGTVQFLLMPGIIQRKFKHSS